MLFKPSSNDGGSFFIGVDIHTRWERIYWESPAGQIVRTLQKHVAAATLPVYDVQTFMDVPGFERAVRFDCSGCYDCEDDELVVYLQDLWRRQKLGQGPDTFQPWQNGLKEGILRAYRTKSGF
jgi:hypothetical protein